MVQKYDVMVTPSGGLPKGRIPPWTRAHLDTVLTYWTGREFFLPLSGYSSHKPPRLNSQEYAHYEPMASAHYLVSQGIPSMRILPEIISFDTISHAFVANLNVSSIKYSSEMEGGCTKVIPGLIDGLAYVFL